MEQRNFWYKTAGNPVKKRRGAKSSARKFPVGILSVGIASLFLLGGCETYDSFVDYVFGSSEVKCPDAKVLADAAVLPAFDPSEVQDQTSVVYTAKMSVASLDCSVRKKLNKAVSDIEITFHVTRAAGGGKAVYRVPYFVALTTNGRVLDKQIKMQDIEFPAGVAAVDVHASIEDIELRASRNKQPINYHYVVGFQLTRAQLDYNRKMGQFEP